MKQNKLERLRNNQEDLKKQMVGQTKNNLVHDKMVRELDINKHVISKAKLNLERI